MMPKTEKELDAYLLLESIKVAHKKKDENYAYMNSRIKETYAKEYISLKEQYLKLINDL